MPRATPAMQKKYRLAVLMIHPIHYFVDLYKEVSRNNQVDLTVYFCSDKSLRPIYDSTCDKTIQWYDASIIKELPHKFLSNYSWKKSIGGFWDVINPHIILELLRNHYDAIEVQGYTHCSAWLAIFGAWITRTPLILKGDAYLLNKRSRFILFLKNIILRFLFRRADAFLGHCSTNSEYYKHYGVPDEKIFFVPYTINNDFFQKKARMLLPQKNSLRKQYGLNSNIFTILSTSKLIPRKRVMDLIKAFALLQGKGIKAQLALVGDGSLKTSLEQYIADNNIPNVHFFGFIPQDAISDFYAMADTHIMTSCYDQWGYVTNEAMNFALPVITTDMVGTSYDIVKHGINGFVYKTGDAEQLAQYIQKLSENTALRQKMGEGALATINLWNYQKAVEGIISALQYIKKSHVIVANPGSHHLWRTALALQKAGFLKYYLTSILYRENKFPYFFIKLLPSKIKNKLREKFKNRSYEELDARRVKTFGFYEWLYALTKFLKNHNLSFYFIEKRNTRISKKAGVISQQGGVLWSGMDSSEMAFAAAKKKGVICVLDQFIGHPLNLNKILEEEIQLHPHLKNVCKDIIPKERVKKILKEMEMADYIVAGSEFAHDTLKEHNIPKQKIETIPYGVDTAHFTPGTRRFAYGDTINLLFVGNISVRKGCHYLLEAVKQLKKEGVKLKLVMIGTMEDKFFREKYGEYFEWISWANRNELPTYFQRADIYVYPSLFEGSALSIYEALASGLPVITTPNSGSIVENNKEGFIVPIRDVAAIKEKMRLLYDNPPMLHTMSLAARKKTEIYTWDTYQEEVIHFIKKFDF